MNVIKNEVEHAQNYLEIAGNDECPADVEIFAQEWLEKNYDDNEYVAEVSQIFQANEEKIWIVEYNVNFRKEKILNCK